MIASPTQLHTLLSKYFNSAKLPGEEYQDLMMPEARKHVNFGHKEPAKKSAVLMLLYKEDEQWHLILTKRNEYNGSHSAQICLPGGKKEEHDKDLQTTALRETQEEIGYKCDEQNIVGQLSPVYIHVSNYIIEPYIAVVTHKPKLSIDKLEVNHVIDLPLENILLDKHRSSKELTIKGMTFTTPTILTENDFIWGATAMILAEFSEVLKRIGSNHII